MQFCHWVLPQNSEAQNDVAPSDAQILESSQSNVKWCMSHGMLRREPQIFCFCRVVDSEQLCKIRFRRWRSRWHGFTVGYYFRERCGRRGAKVYSKQDKRKSRPALRYSTTINLLSGMVPNPCNALSMLWNVLSGVSKKIAKFHATNSRVRLGWCSERYGNRILCAFYSDLCPILCLLGFGESSNKYSRPLLTGVGLELKGERPKTWAPCFPALHFFLVASSTRLARPATLTACPNKQVDRHAISIVGLGYHDWWKKNCLKNPSSTILLLEYPISVCWSAEQENPWSLNPPTYTFSLKIWKRKLASGCLWQKEEK